MRMETNFHMKKLAPELALKKRPKVIRKWPISLPLSSPNGGILWQAFLIYVSMDRMTVIFKVPRFGFLQNRKQQNVLKVIKTS